MCGLRDGVRDDVSRSVRRHAFDPKETHRMLTMAKDALNIEKNEVINFPVSSP